MFADMPPVLRRLVLLSAFLPFLLVSLVGAGLMPARTADGVVMVLCTGQGIQEIRIDPATGDPVPAQPDGGPCDWALAHGPLTLPTTTPLALPIRVAAPARPAPGADDPGLCPRHRAATCDRTSSDGLNVPDTNLSSHITSEENPCPT